MNDQKEVWDEFYRANNRPWRGVSDLSNLPFPAVGHILEIGCGNGKTIAALMRKGYKVSGVDFSQAAIDSCKKQFKDIDLKVASADNLPFDDQIFDGVIVFHVLEHLEFHELLRAVSESSRVLKYGGHILVKVFSLEDMRSEKGEKINDSTMIRGNGIRYHYFTENELRSLYFAGEIVKLTTKEEFTKFGKKRSRIEMDFVKC